jgi:hypothetical protein
VLEGTIPRNSRTSFLNGSTVSSSRIRLSTRMINTPVGSPTTRAAGCSAWPSSTGAIQRRCAPSNLQEWYLDLPSFTRVRAGIRDRSDGHIVTDLSFPTFLYEGYKANPDDLEEGLFKGKILVQVCGT